MIEPNLLTSLPITDSKTKQTSVQLNSRYRTLTAPFLNPITRSQSIESSTSALETRHLRVPQRKHLTPLAMPGYIRTNVNERQAEIIKEVHKDIGITLMSESKEKLSSVPTFINRLASPPLEELLRFDPQLEHAQSISDFRFFVRNNSERSSSSSNSSRTESPMSSTKPDKPNYIDPKIDKLWRKHSLSHLKGQKEDAIKAAHEATCALQSRRIFHNVASNRPQRPAKPEEVFTLIRSAYNSGDDCYQMLGNNGTYQPAHGDWIFVVTASQPHNVQCMLESRLIPGQPPGQRQGHTSISQGEDVLAAGTLRFNQGTLRSWKNDSGHYATRASLMLKNLMPLKHLLPRNKFFYAFEKSGRKGQRVFLSGPPLVKPLPEELGRLIRYPLDKCPEKYKSDIQRITNVYETAHYLKNAFLHQVSAQKCKLLTADIYDLQTINDILELENLDPYVGRGFLIAYFKMLTLVIKNEWLDPEEIFYAVSQRPRINSESLIEHCATLVGKSGEIAQSQAEFLSTLFKTNKVDKNTIMTTLLGHFDLISSKEIQEKNTGMLHRIGEWIQNKKTIQADGGYYIRLFNKTHNNNLQNVQLLYKIFENTRSLPTQSIFINLLSNKKRKELESAFKKCHRDIYSSKNRRTNVAKQATPTPQDICHAFRNFSLTKSLHSQLVYFDKKLQDEIVNIDIERIVNEQRVDIKNFWESKIHPYEKNYVAKEKESVYFTNDKNEVWEKISNLPDLFFPRILEKCKKSIEIKRWAQMQSRENYESLAIYNKKAPSKIEKDLWQQNIVQSRIVAYEKMHHIINQIIEENLERISLINTIKSPH